MIVDQLANAGLYHSVHPLFPKAFAFLEKFDLSTPDGKIELESDRLFAMVQRYETKPASERKFEAHRRMIDIQYIASGRETMGCGPLGAFPVTMPYDEAKDAELYGAAEASVLRVQSGDFCIFYPQDVHQPGCHWADQPGEIIKVVMKIRL